MLGPSPGQRLRNIALESAPLICKMRFDGSDYEECLLLGHKTQVIPHRRHITPPLQCPAD
jgi:hypothetical protein